MFSPCLAVRPCQRLPHRLDPKSLETLGESKLRESIDEDRPTFSPHTKVDVDRKRLVGFGQHMLQDVSAVLLSFQDDPSGSRCSRSDHATGHEHPGRRDEPPGVSGVYRFPL